MKDPENIIQWLKVMAQVAPPSGVVLVGAGDGTCEWTSLLSEMPDTDSILVEANGQKFKMLECIAERQPSWRVLNKVIAKVSGICDFYESSISSEDSLLNPDLLRDLWPNIKSHQVTSRQTVSLEELFSENGFDWLLINCLPALAMIEGAGKCFHGINVIVARVIFPMTDADLNDANLQAVQIFLENQGFRLQAVQVSRHPSLGHALFMRTDCLGNNAHRQKLADAEARIESLLRDLADADSKLANHLKQDASAGTEKEKCIHLQNENEVLTKEIARFEKEAGEKSAKLLSLQNANSELLARQQLMDEEIKKAMIQIELLEKLFGRDSG